MSRSKIAKLKPVLPQFVQPMQCLPVHELPDGEDWTFEVKWDGYRALAVGGAGKVIIYSRNEKRLDPRFPNIVEGLSQYRAAGSSMGKLSPLMSRAGLPSRPFKTVERLLTEEPFTPLIWFISTDWI